MVKKISHKEVSRRMKMNEIAEAQHWIVDFWDDHSQKIIGIVVAIVVVFASGYLIKQSKRNKINNSAAAFSEALNIISKAEKDAYAPSEGPSTNKDEALPLVDEVVNDYASTPSHAPALLLKGSLLAEQGEMEEALATYKKLVSKGGVLAPVGLLGIAACQESLDNVDAAAETYKKILTSYSNSSFSEEANFALAQMLERHDRSDEALDIYKGISEDSAYSDDAKARIDWLEAPVLSLAR